MTSQDSDTSPEHKTPGYFDDGVSVSRNSNINRECFVAGAVYGSQDHPDVLRLRRWRDTVWRSRRLGRLGIRLYDRYGPQLARLVNGRPRLKKLVRDGIGRLVRRL